MEDTSPRYRLCRYSARPQRDQKNPQPSSEDSDPGENPERNDRNIPYEEPDMYSHKQPVPGGSKRQEHYHCQYAHSVSRGTEPYHDLSIDQMLLFPRDDMGKSGHDHQCTR